MVSTRAKLIAAAALAGGGVGSLVAQPPSAPVFAAQSFEVLPPRRLAMPQPPSIYDSENIPVGFFTTSNRQPAAASAPAPVPTTNPNNWLSAPRPASNAPPANPRTANPQGITVMPLFGKPQAPGIQPQISATPPNAPAWRWHGYGSTNTVAAPAVVATLPASAANSGLQLPEASSTNLPMPTPMPMPAGPVLPSDSRPITLPSYSPPAPGGPINAVPLPMGPSEPSWKPLDSRSGFFRNQQREPDRGVMRTNATATTPPADPWTVSRAVFNPPSDQTGQPTIEKPQPSATNDGPLVVLRSTIETVIAGRGRDLEMFYRGPNNLLIRLKVRVAADAEQMANRISKLPEIAPYHVTYEIAVVE